MAQKIIGLDLGTHEVKVVVLHGGFRGFTVGQYISHPVPQDSPDEEIPLTDRLKDALNHLIDQDPALFNADSINTAVPGSMVTAHILSLPFSDSRKIEQTLAFQLEDQIPFDLDDIVFDYQVLWQTENKTDILVGVVLKKTLASLLEMLESIGIDPRVVSLSSLAYQNLFAHGVLSSSFPEQSKLPEQTIQTCDTEKFPELNKSSDSEALNQNDMELTESGFSNTGTTSHNDSVKEPAWTENMQDETKHVPEEGKTSHSEVFSEAILDIGHLSSDLCILENGIARSARSFKVAGLGLSIAIASSEKISLAEAESLKHEAINLVETDERGPRIAASIERGIAPLVRNLRQSFFAHKSRFRKQIKRVYITGGTARLPGLDNHLARELGCEVFPLDPFPPHLEKNLPEGQRDDPAAALAMALALRSQGGAHTAKVNFRKGQFAYKGDLSHLKGILPRIALIGILVIALLLTNVFVRFQALSIEEKRVDEQLCEMTEKVLGACMTNPDDAISRLHGQRASASIVPNVSAAEILSEVVRRLTGTEGIELTELDVGSSRVRLQGEADSFDAVARVVSGLQGYECFSEVAQGQTRQARQSQKIEFNVDASLTEQCGN